jgi:hypothetical protein
MRTFILALLLVISSFSYGQTPSGVVFPLLECNSGICPAQNVNTTNLRALYGDSTHNTIYVGGKFSAAGSQMREGLAAITANTGALLPWTVAVNAGGEVHAVARSGDTIYIGGRFDQINGVNRRNIAAVRASTGNLINMLSTGTGSANDTIFSLLIHNNFLYAGGRFTTIQSTARSNLAQLTFAGSVTTLTSAVNGVIRQLLPGTNQIFARTASTTLPQSRIYKINTTSGSSQIIIQTDPLPDHYFTDFVVRGDTTYVVGSFYMSTNQQTAENFVVVNTINYYKRHVAFSLNVPFEMPNIRVEIELHRDTLLLATFDGNSRLNPGHRLYKCFFRGAALQTIKIYNSNQTAMNSYINNGLMVMNGYLFEAERFTQHGNINTSSTSVRLFSYCLRPQQQPNNFIFPTNTICQGDTGFLQIAPSASYYSYNWICIPSNAATLIPNGPSVEIAVPNSTTGTFAVQVRGVSGCGIVSLSARSYTITVLPKPDADAGVSDSTTCNQPTATLRGSSLTPGVTYSWSGPASSGADTITSGITGTYILLVTAPNGCKNTDSAAIIADTIPPVIQTWTSIPDLTCIVDTVVLDASGLYPNDSISWTSPSLSSFTNPVYAVISDNYLLQITSRRNGCSAFDTLFVDENRVLPSATFTVSNDTLTCAQPNTLLTGSSATTGTTLFWQDTAQTNLGNPANVNTVGAYQLIVTNMINGCVNNSNFAIIEPWFTPPHLNPITSNPTITCSSDSVTLQFASLTQSATCNWTTPSGTYFGFQITTADTGWHYVLVTDSLNGCSRTDSVFVTYLPQLLLTTSNDTVICHASGAVLQSAPIGGTPPFQITWNNNGGNGSPVTVYPNDTLYFTTVVTDNAGCIGTDSVLVTPASPISDSTLSFQPCDPNSAGGEIQVYPYGSVPPYEISIDNGLTWQNNGIFSGLPFGSYSFIVRDSLGCTHTLQADIDSNSLLPAANFIVSTQAQLNDTLVFVDISNPRPDSVSWDFPNTFSIVGGTPNAPYIIAQDTGCFNATMHIWYGTCELTLTKSVCFGAIDSTYADYWNNLGIDTMIVYPNPNNGQFNLSVSLHAKQHFVITVHDASGNERIRIPVAETDTWSGPVAIPNPIPGSYVVRVIAEFDAAELIIVVTQ